MFTFAKRFLDDDTGASALEYALICSLIALVCVWSIGALGYYLQKKYQLIYDTFWPNG